MVLVIDRPDKLSRLVKGRVVGVDFDHGQNRGELLAGGEEVLELLLDDVADHAFRLGAEHIERKRLVRLVSGTLQGEQADLRSIAVRDDEFVLHGERRKRGRSNTDVRALVFRGKWFAAFQERVSTQSDDDAHGVRSRSWRQGSP